MHLNLKFSGFKIKGLRSFNMEKCFGVVFALFLYKLNDKPVLFFILLPEYIK